MIFSKFIDSNQPDLKCFVHYGAIIIFFYMYNNILLFLSYYHLKCQLSRILTTTKYAPLLRLMLVTHL